MRSNCREEEQQQEQLETRLPRVAASRSLQSKKSKRKRRKNTSPTRRKQEEEEKRYDQLDLSRLGPEIVSAQLHSPAARIHSPRRLPNLLNSRPKTIGPLATHSPKNVLSSPPASSAAAFRKNVSPPGSPLRPNSRATVLLPPGSPSQSIRPKSRALAYSLNVLDEAEGRRVRTPFNDPRNELMTPDQKRKRGKLDSMLNHVRELSSRQSMRSDLGDDVTMCMEPWYPMNNIPSRSATPDRKVPSVPFGHLAYERLSWIPADAIDLRLWCNQVTDVSILRLLECDRTCTKLDLRGCVHLTDVGLEYIGDCCQGLEVLLLAGCSNISDNGIDVLLEVCGESLIEIDLNRKYTHINDDTVACKCCDRLRCYKNDMSRTTELHITERGVRSVARYCPNLRAISLEEQRAAVTNEAISLLASCKRLSSISVTGCPDLGQEAMKVLGKKCSGSLASLNVQNCFRINDEGLREVVGRSYHLRSLNLSGLPKLTDVGIRGFLETKVMWGYRQHAGFVHLKSLSLAGAVLVTDVTLSWIASGCPNMQELDLSNCSNVLDYGLRALGTLDNLKSLELRGCTLLTDQGIMHLITHEARKNRVLTRLRRLSLSGLSVSDNSLIPLVQTLSHSNGAALGDLELFDVLNISDGFLRNLALHAGPNLTSLAISNNSLISAAGVGALGQRSKYLSKLQLRSCSQVGDDSIRALEHLRNLQELNVGESTKISIPGILALPNWKLRVLSLSKNLSLNDDTLRKVINLCADLQVLDISFCKLLSDGSLLGSMIRDCGQDQPCLVHTLNVTQCPIISDEALLKLLDNQEACHGTRLSCMVPAGNKGFTRGFVLDQGSRLRRHQNEAEREKRYEVKAALVLQCYIRSRNARARFRKLQLARLREKIAAATQIQKMGRRLLARLFYEELHFELRYLATRCQYLWRRYHMRKMRKRALKFWTNRTLNASFFAWKQNVAEQIYQRLSALEKEKASTAFQFWTDGILRKLWFAWKRYVKYCRWKKESYPKALKFFAQRSLRRCFETWFGFYKPRNHRRRVLVAIFLNCVPLNARNATFHKSLVYVAKKKHETSIKMRVILGLREVVALSKKQFAVAMEFMRSQMMSCPGEGQRMGLGFTVFRNWRLYASSQAQLRETQERVKNLTVRWAKRRTLVLLGKHAAQKMITRKQTRIAYNLLHNSLLLKSFTTWKTNMRELQERRANAARAMAYFSNSCLCKSFIAWSNHIRTRKDNDAKVLASISKLLLRQVHVCFQSWKGLALEQIQFKQRIHNSMFNRTRAKVFERWRDFASWSRTRRYAQLTSWVQLNAAACRIQARYRGMRGRESIEDERIMKQFMAIRIQSLMRRCLAKKVLNRMDRRRILKDYIMQEKETDQMTLEDQDGFALRAEYMAARYVQLQFRARQSRDKVYEAKRIAARKREERRKENQRVLTEKHHKMEEERVKDLEHRNLVASKFQALWYGSRARLKYRDMWIDAYDFKYCTQIQKIVRARAARLKFAAKKRHKFYLTRTREQQKVNARIMRLLLLRNRRQQEAGASALDAIGLHPDTFTLDRKKLIMEILTDMRDWTRMARSHYQAFKQAGTDANKREEIIRAFYQRLSDEAWIQKGDAVKIVSPQSVHRGKTGYVLNLRKVGTLPGGQQAAVKLDSCGRVVFLAIRTAPTPSENSTNTMIRIDKMNKTFEASKITPKLVEENREKLLERAAVLLEEHKEKKAALSVQRTYRGKTFRLKFKEEYTRQKKIDQLKQARLLKILKALGMDNARTGRVLVALGLVWPRYIPQMEEKPFALEIWWRKQKFSGEVKKFRNERLGDVVLDHHQTMKTKKEQMKNSEKEREMSGLVRARMKTNVHYKSLRNLLEYELDNEADFEALRGLKAPPLAQLIKDEEKSKLRWRQRSPLTLACWKGLDKLTDKVLAPMAERLFKLKTKAESREKVKMAKLYNVLAQVVGGPEWRRSPEDRMTWLGVYAFEQLRESKHVSLEGYAVYHGTWNKSGHPHGYGVIEFPDGKGLENILSKYSDLFRHGGGTSKSTLSSSLDEETETFDEDGFFTDSEDEQEHLKLLNGEENREGEEDKVEQLLKTMKMSAAERLKSSKSLRNSNSRQQSRQRSRGSNRNRMRTGTGSGSEANPQIPQYDSIACIVSDGLLCGDVFINYDNGATYEGPYVEEMFTQQDTFSLRRDDIEHFPMLKDENEEDDEGEDDVGGDLDVEHDGDDEYEGEEGEEEYEDDEAEDDLAVIEEHDEELFLTSDHFGIWTTPHGVSYEGSAVTNHFDENHINGLIRVSFGSGPARTNRSSSSNYRPTETYFGEMRGGLRDGKGRMDFENGDQYKGEWKNDVPHGKGMYMWAETRTAYMGYFVEGRQQGKGRQTFPDGSRYQGYYVDDEFHGSGKLMLPNGDMYEGEFEEGEFQGYGEMYYHDGCIYKGEWNKGIRHTAIGETGEFTDRERNVYTVPFVDGEMDGQGILSEATSNEWNLEKHGVWKRGKLLHWIGVSINPGSTDEFCSRFKTYGDYKGLFGVLVAQMLPELPPGVDAEDRRVEQHVNGILRRAGAMAGTTVIEKSQIALENYVPVAEEAKKTYKHLTEAYEQVQKAFAAAKYQAEKCTADVEELTETRDKLRRDIRYYWKDNQDAYEKKRSYKKIVHRLKKYSHAEWFECKMATYTPILWDYLWEGMARILLPHIDGKKTVPKKDIEMLCNGSQTNMELGDPNAMLRTYKVKILDDIAYFNVYDRSKQKRMLTDVSRFVFHRDMKPGNEELAHICLLSSPLIVFLKAIYEYTLVATKITPSVDKLADVERELEILQLDLVKKVEAFHLYEEEVRELEKRKAAALFEMEHSQERLKEVKLNLERAIKCNEAAEVASGDCKLLHKFSGEEERDQDDILPWLSREDEYIRNECMISLNGVLEMVCNIDQEIWDVMFNMKEYLVATENYEHQYFADSSDSEFIPMEVRDLMGSIVNQVAGFTLCEPEVEDYVNEVLFEFGGGPTNEVRGILDDLCTKAEDLYHFEENARKRDGIYLGKRVAVTVTVEGESYAKFGTCVKTGDYNRPIYSSIEPGTGSIYLDDSCYDIYGFDDAQFGQEIGSGDVLCLPNRHGEIVEKEIFAVLDDFHLQLSTPYYYNDEVPSLGAGWTKEWGFRKVGKVVERIQCEVFDVEFEDGTFEEKIDLARVNLAAASDDELDGADEEDSDGEDLKNNVEGEKEEEAGKYNAAGDDDDYPGSEEDIDFSTFQIWCVLTCPETGNDYYHCESSGITTWDEPPHYKHIWFEYEDEGTGFLYWSNFTDTTWIKPVKSSSSKTA